MKRFLAILLIPLVGCMVGKSSVGTPDGVKHSSKVYSVFSNSAVGQMNLQREIRGTNFVYKSGVEVDEVQTSPETVALNIVASVLANQLGSQIPGSGGAGGLSAEDVVKIIEASKPEPQPEPEPVSVPDPPPEPENG